jgi:hypothetical protein
VKLDDEPSGKTSLANDLIAELGGISTPEGRALTNKNAPEWTGITHALQAKIGDDAAASADAGRASTAAMIGDAEAIWLMPKIGSPSLLDLAMRPGDRVPALLALANEAAMRQIGRLAVMDGFLANWDRFLQSTPGQLNVYQPNLGNVMLDVLSGRVVAIDSSIGNTLKRFEDQIADQQQRNRIVSAVGLLEVVFDSFDQWVDGFFTSLRAASETNQGQPLPNLRIGNGDLADPWRSAKDYIHRGVMIQAARLAAALRAGGRGRQAFGRAGLDDRYETAKLNARYAELRAAGTSHEDATTELLRYRRQRRARAARPWGLKWTSKTVR